MTFAEDLAEALGDIAGELGTPATFRRYTHTADDLLAGTKGTATLAGTAEAMVVVQPTRDAHERGGSGGRTGIERLDVWVRAEDVGWTPTREGTTVELGGVTYRPAAVEAEDGGLTHRLRLERLESV